MRRKSEKTLILLAVTSYKSMGFFDGQIEFLQKAGYEIAVICSCGWENKSKVEYYPVNMEREISVWKDLISLIKIIYLVFRLKPDIVNAGTPKAGLLVTIAAFLNNVPFRIYTCHGLRLETLHGIKKSILKLTETISAFCAHKVICVSESLRKKYIDLITCSNEKVIVLGQGTCNGIDLQKIDKNVILAERKLYNLYSEKDRYIGYVGRLTKDKGVIELIQAFDILKQKFSDLHLLLIGNFEKGDPISHAIKDRIKNDPRIVATGYIDNVLPYYQLMDIFLLPTYREGFPTVILEAGAFEVPVVASKVTGCVDAIIDEVTGILVEAGNVNALVVATECLLLDKEKCLYLGRNARKRIEDDFRQEVVWKAIANFYKSGIKEINYKILKEEF